MRMESMGLPRVWFVSLIVYVVMCFTPYSVYSKAFQSQSGSLSQKTMTGQTTARKLQHSNTSLIRNLRLNSNDSFIARTIVRPTSTVQIQNDEIDSEIREYVQMQLSKSTKADAKLQVSELDDAEIFENPAAERLHAQDVYKMIHFRSRSILKGLSMNDRLKRYIYGKDSRLHLYPALTQKFPFSAVVRLGSGCSGTVIWYKHVLTAAHCVHDGSNFLPLWKLSVGVLRENGTFKWFSVKRIFVAKQWIRKKGFRKLGHDYAVIELFRDHGRGYMRFGYHPAPIGRTIQFAGFPIDKPFNQMWFSHCSIKKHTKRRLYNSCDAMPGMSGSGVYVYEKKMPRHRSSSKATDHDRKLVAILSTFRGKMKNGRITEGHNIATRLTKRKVERICHWIRAGGQIKACAMGG